MENPDGKSLCSPRGPGPVALARGGEAAPSSQPRPSAGTGMQHSSPARLLPRGRDETLPFPTASPTIGIAPLFADSCRLAFPLGSSSYLCTQKRSRLLRACDHPCPENCLPIACCKASLARSFLCSWHLFTRRVTQ